MRSARFSRDSSWIGSRFEYPIGSGQQSATRIIDWDPSGGRYAAGRVSTDRLSEADRFGADSFGADGLWGDGLWGDGLWGDRL